MLKIKNTEVVSDEQIPPSIISSSIIFASVDEYLLDTSCPSVIEENFHPGSILEENKDETNSLISKDLSDYSDEDENEVYEQVWVNGKMNYLTSNELYILVLEEVIELRQQLKQPASNSYWLYA
jgi:hypothetical protein